MAEYLEKSGLKKSITALLSIENVAPNIKQFVLNIIDGEMLADVQPVDRWISCKDKMPEEYKTVLVYEKDYGVMIGELEKKFFDTQFFIARKSGMILRTTEVTHWQPLPEPPKDGEQNETD